MSVWHKAAEMIETGREEYSCIAINDACPTRYDRASDNPLVQRYAELFRPHRGEHAEEAWFSITCSRGDAHLRIVALCFAHEVFKRT